MERRTLPTVAALAAAAGLLITACGGGDNSSEANDKIAGAATGNTATSASPGTINAAGRPKISLPSDLTDTFESWQTGDSTKDAVLQDVALRVDATNYAITQGSADLPALTFYYSGGALADAKDWVESLVKDGYSITGVNRYYNAKVDVFDSASAGVVYCEDQSKAFARDRKTSKVYKTEVNDDSYVMYSTRLEKNEQAVWQTTRLASKRGHKSCTP